MNISIFDWFSMSFKFGAKRYRAVWKYTLIFLLIQLVALCSIIGALFIPSIAIAHTRLLYLMAKNETVSVKACLKYGFEDGMWWRSTCFVMLRLLVVIVGMIFAFFPGICMAVILFFAETSFIEEKKGIFNSFSHSSTIVKQVGFFKIFSYMLLPFIYWLMIYILGTPGIMVSWLLHPFVSCLAIIAYLDIQNKSKLA